jgi:FkbM family methyltransferase
VKARLKAQIRRFMPRTVRRHRILSGPLRGYWIVTSWHDYPAAILGRTERGLLKWFDANVQPEETWLDVGAHYGYTAIALARRVGPRGRVFAFEPELETAGYLERTGRLNHLTQMTVVPVALGDPESLTMNRLPVVRGMLDHTLTTPGDSSASFVTARFDWLWERICNDRRSVHGIKIDVQGMEIEVLKGMSASLAEFTPKLVLEVHEGVDRLELLALIEAAGYSRQGEPVETGARTGPPQYLDDHSYSFGPSS